MIALRSCRRIACVSVSLVALAGICGCQSGTSSATWSSKRSSADTSANLDVAMAAVSESSFSNAHQFHYFANAGVYRDCDENRWLWSCDEGETWIASENLPGHIVLGNEIPFAVTLTTNDPTPEHALIAAAYPAGQAPTTVTVQGSNDFER